MREIALNNRDGYTIKLVETDCDRWLIDFGNFPSWGAISILGNENNIKAIDPTPGGPMISVGGEFNGNVIEKIERTNKGYIIHTRNGKD